MSQRTEPEESTYIQYKCMLCMLADLIEFQFQSNFNKKHAEAALTTKMAIKNFLYSFLLPIESFYTELVGKLLNWKYKYNIV